MKFRISRLSWDALYLIYVLKYIFFEKLITIIYFLSMSNFNSGSKNCFHFIKSIFRREFPSLIPYYDSMYRSIKSEILLSGKKRLPFLTFLKKLLQRKDSLNPTQLEIIVNLLQIIRSPEYYLLPSPTKKIIKFRLTNSKDFFYRKCHKTFENLSVLLDYYNERDEEMSNMYKNQSTAQNLAMQSNEFQSTSSGMGEEEEKNQEIDEHMHVTEVVVDEEYQEEHEIFVDEDIFEEKKEENFMQIKVNYLADSSEIYLNNLASPI